MSDEVDDPFSFLRLPENQALRPVRRRGRSRGQAALLLVCILAGHLILFSLGTLMVTGKLTLPGSWRPWPTNSRAAGEPDHSAIAPEPRQVIVN